MFIEAALKLYRNIARQYAYFKKLFQVNLILIIIFLLTIIRIILFVFFFIIICPRTHINNMFFFENKYLK